MAEEYLQDFWSGRWRDGTTTWNIEQPAPAFVHLLSQKQLPPGKAAIFGCGHGHDAALFGRHGYDVTGFDFVPKAVALATDRYGDDASFVEADIFNLPPQYHQAFDYVIEHTCFCAIRPHLRGAYVQAVLGALKPGGRLVGIFWTNNNDEPGPPYHTEMAHLEELLVQPGYFETEHMDWTKHSVPERISEEFLGIFRKIV